MVAAYSCSEHGPTIGRILRGRPEGFGFGLLLHAFPAPAAAVAMAFGLGGIFRVFFLEGWAMRAAIPACAPRRPAAAACLPVIAGVSSMLKMLLSSLS